ncbi:MAG: hypothetical protein ACI9Y7_001507 [Dokdonia sp.]|jgi:hypothetical protein
MKNFYLLLCFSLFVFSCSSDENEDTGTFSLLGAEYQYTFPDCTPDPSGIAGCISFANFINDTQVDILLGGGDIVYRENYERIESSVVIDFQYFEDLVIRFEIVDELTLRDIDSGNLWLRVN